MGKHEAPCIARREEGPTDRGPDFDVRVSHESDRSWVTVRGDLDTDTAPRLVGALRSVTREARDVGVDVGGLTFIDAAGVNVLFGAVHDLGTDHRLMLRSLSPMAARIVAVTGLDHWVDVIDDAHDPSAATDDAPESSTPLTPPVTVSDGVCWPTVAGLGAIHLGGLAGLVWVVTRFSMATLVLALVTHVLCGMSISAGYHRLFAHRTYRTVPIVRWALLAFGAGAFQNSALAWSADHRAHHADTDGWGDPHAITRGVWFAHAGWLFRRREASANLDRLTDLVALRSVRLQHRYFAAIAVGVGLVLPAAIAASWGDLWGGLLVAGALRATVMLQATFCVNSLAHMIGTQRYDNGASARDSAVVAVVTFGEGYHSFHHRFPFDYRNGIRWWQYDPSKWLIWSLRHLGLASKLRVAAPSSITRAAARPRPASLAAPLLTRS